MNTTKNVLIMELNEALTTFNVAECYGVGDGIVVSYLIESRAQKTVTDFCERNKLEFSAFGNSNIHIKVPSSIREKKTAIDDAIDALKLVEITAEKEVSDTDIVSKCLDYLTGLTKSFPIIKLQVPQDKRTATT